MLFESEREVDSIVTSSLFPNVEFIDKVLTDHF